jgi:hypothetical protein
VNRIFGDVSESFALFVCRRDITADTKKSSYSLATDFAHDRQTNSFAGSQQLKNAGDLVFRLAAAAALHRVNWHSFGVN